MARVQIELPKNAAIADIKVPVRITDINYGNHLANDAVVSIIHEARVQFLQQNGFSELDISGVSLIMSDLAVQFKNEGFYGDVLNIEIFASDISNVRFQLKYKISTRRNEKVVLIAWAATTMVGYNYETRKPCKLPQQFLDLLTQS